MSNLDYETQERMKAKVAAPVHPMDDAAEMKRRYAALALEFAKVSAELTSVKTSQLVGVILSPENTPTYELKEPYYSPDDIFYPAGAQFQDVTGTIIPNEMMIPLNKPAEERMHKYLSSQPHAAHTPPMELIIQAAMEARPREGDDPKTFAENQANIVRRAIELNYQRMGIMPGEHPEPRVLTVKRPPANVPLMANTKIAGQSTARGPAQTRLHAAPVNPSQKSAPAMGTVSSAPVSQPHEGVTL